MLERFGFGRQPEELEMGKKRIIIGSFNTQEGYEKYFESLINQNPKWIRRDDGRWDIEVDEETPPPGAKKH